LAFDDNSVELEPIVLERHMDSVEEEVDVRTLAYKMVRPYIVEVDYHIEGYAGSCVDVDCTHTEAWLVVDYTHKIRTDFESDFDNSHKDLPFPWAQSRNHRYVLRDGQLELELVLVRSELGVQVPKRLQLKLKLMIQEE
jgi:hypothetical protein